MSYTHHIVPSSLQAYASHAQTTFDGMHTSMQSMVDAVAGLMYQGDNGTYFKNQTGQMLSEFTAAFNKDLAAVAEMISTVTTNLCTALGGQPIHIEVPTKAITPTVESVPGDGSQTVDLPALEALPAGLKKHFSDIRTAISDHLALFQNSEQIGWVSDSKPNADSAVQKWSVAATGLVDDSESSIEKFVTEQVHNVRSGDNAPAV